MAFFGALFISYLFLFIAHSTLLYFLVRDRLGSRIPLTDLILPWPSTGRFVAMLAFASSLLFVFIAFLVIPRTPAAWAAVGHRWLYVALAFGVLSAFYASYIWRRVSRPSPGARLEFTATQATPGELRAPILLAAAVNLIHYLAK